MTIPNKCFIFAVHVRGRQNYLLNLVYIYKGVSNATLHITSKGVFEPRRHNKREHETVQREGKTSPKTTQHRGYCDELPVQKLS